MMNKNKSTPVLLGLCLLLAHYSSASNLVDSLQQRMVTYNLEKPAINLYVHLDKNIYTPEDTIWFKAYVLSPILNEVLYVRITDDKKNIVLEKQFLMYDIRAHGDIWIPDTLAEGKYYFYAYTDRMISLNPNDVFVQPITVSKNIMNRLEAEASVTNLKKVHRGDKVEILAKVKGAAGKVLKGYFNLWVGNEVLKKGRLSTNIFGEAYVRFTYPKIADTEMVRCEIKFALDKDYAELALNLRHEGNAVKVSVYPEGGQLLAGVLNNVVFEALDDYKNPMETVLVLKEEKKSIGTIKTNKQGIGNLLFCPQNKAHYTIEIHENDTIKTVEFPYMIESHGYGLRMEEGKDRRSAILSNKGNNDTAIVVIRSLNKILWSQKLSVKSDDSTIIDLPVNDQPKGILNLAVFDTIGLPKTDRLFMNKVDNEYQVQINTKKFVKNGQARITVNLNINDIHGIPAATNLSVSIVEKSTLNKAEYRTILQSFYFKNMIFPNNSVINEQEPDFDKRLITTNWGKYDWDRIVNFKPTGYIRLLENAGGIFGEVMTKDNKPLKIKELTLETTSLSDRGDVSDVLKLLQSRSSSMQNSKMNLNKISFTVLEGSEKVPLTDNGFFSISPKSLLIQPNETKTLKLGALFSDNHNIEVTDYAKELDEIVRASDALEFPQPFNTFSKYEAPVVKTLKKAVLLKEVTVEARGERDSDRNLGKKGDYICREFNVFNCVNHVSGGKKPIAGTVYAQNDRGNPFLYNGPGKRFSAAPEGSRPGSIIYLPLKNISMPSSFYLPSAADTAFLPTDSRTTVYWAPNLYTDTTGKTNFEFNTSDRKTDFIIIVQGIEVKTRRPIYCTYDLIL